MNEEDESQLAAPRGQPPGRQGRGAFLAADGHSPRSPGRSGGPQRPGTGQGPPGAEGRAGRRGLALGRQLRGKPGEGAKEEGPPRPEAAEAKQKPKPEETKRDAARPCPAAAAAARLSRRVRDGRRRLPRPRHGPKPPRRADEPPPPTAGLSPLAPRLPACPPSWDMARSTPRGCSPR
ncbi:collagen alpha-1(I) chain [Bos taurus]|uniref:collagen alpha-1(I) chain n=1 Tax=Bos taurus TaxID=9913 RepID=UPI0000EBC2A8|nr:collagen alpha-1(I) chain-like [Bos taurus]